MVGSSYLKDMIKVVIYLILSKWFDVQINGRIGELISSLLFSSAFYMFLKSNIKTLRELVNEREGEMYFVYYNLESDSLPKNFLIQLLPQFGDTDFLSGCLNMKMSHCAAWFTTENYTYTTFEITCGHANGIISEQVVLSTISQPCAQSDIKQMVYMQLVKKSNRGFLRDDEMKVDWRRRYRKRTKSIEEIEQYAIQIFNELNVIDSNCQQFTERLIDFAGS